MKPYPHQIALADDAYEILREHMIVYLACEERTGKTLASILVAEKTKAKDILVITKKKALGGWKETLANFTHTKNYTVTNYHQAHKVTKRPGLVILDESHNYVSSVPKPGKIHTDVLAKVYGCPIIYISATPHAQGHQMLFHQFQLSAWSPWKDYRNFYKWFKVYGIPFTIEINSINVPQYTRTKRELVLKDVDHLFLTRTRSELGFAQEPEDCLYFIELDEATKNTYNHLIEHDMVNLSVGSIIADSGAKLRVSLHQLEGGTIKIEDERFELKNNEKIRWILENFGDTSDTVIMYHYQAELPKLKKHFKEAVLLQATSYAEGVDLHEHDNLVIYSQDFSTARHTQRRARQCNMKREKPIKVHYLLVKNAISHQVYKTVNTKKKNFVDSVFERKSL